MPLSPRIRSARVPSTLSFFAILRSGVRLYGATAPSGCSGRQHVKGDHKGGEPRDQGPDEQADHQERPARPGTACTRFIVPVAGARSPRAVQLCLRPPNLLLQARPFLLLPLGPPLHLHSLLALPLEVFGQPLALLLQAFRFLLYI